MFLLACVPPLKRSVHIVEGLVQHDQHVLLPVKVVEDVPLEVLLAVLCAEAATMTVKHSKVEQVRSQLYHSISGRKMLAMKHSDSSQKYSIYVLDLLGHSCSMFMTRKRIFSKPVFLIAPPPFMSGHTNHACFNAWHHLSVRFKT